MPQVFSLPFKDRAAHPLAGVTVIQIIPGLEANPTARAAIEIAAALGLKLAGEDEQQARQALSQLN